jgi:hypothetical protein
MMKRAMIWETSIINPEIGRMMIIGLEILVKRH